MTDALPDDLLAALRDWGPRWHESIGDGRDAMLAAWSGRHRSAASLPITADQAYGPHPRHVLDIHAADAAAGPLPVLVFVHGGAFVRGDKAMTPAVYGNVPAEFARHGFVAVNVEYRLAPEAPWPEGAIDVRDAVLWLERNVGRWGGDPARMFLMGHSAACAHCATAAWDDRVRPAGGLPIAGLVLVSPRVRVDCTARNPNAAGVLAYYGSDESRHADRAPIAQVRPDAPPTFVATAQHENPLLDHDAFALAHRLARQAEEHGGPMVRMVQLPDHNHMSIVIQFDTGHGGLGASIRDWMDRVVRGDYRSRASLAAPSMPA